MNKFNKAWRTLHRKYKALLGESKEDLNKWRNIMDLFHREYTVAHNHVIRAGELKSVSWLHAIHISCSLILLA